MHKSKCICFCLELPPYAYINISHFRKINWLLVEQAVELCTVTNVLKHLEEGLEPSHLNDTFILSLPTLDGNWHQIYNFLEQINLQKSLTTEEAASTIFSTHLFKKRNSLIIRMVIKFVVFVYCWLLLRLFLIISSIFDL